MDSAGDLWEQLESPDRRVREHAAHQIEQLPAPDKELVLRFMPRIDDWIVRSRYCLIVPRLSLTTEERREAFETARGFLHHKSSILRTFAMQTMFDLAQQDPAYLDDVTEIVDHAAATGTKAMKARARHILKKLTPKTRHPRAPRQTDARR